MVKISFTTNDYCVSEDNGTVYVCLTKNIVAAEDVVIDVTASENFLSNLIGYAQGQLSCLDILLRSEILIYSDIQPLVYSFPDR